MQVHTSIAGLTLVSTVMCILMLPQGVHAEWCVCGGRGWGSCDALNFAKLIAKKELMS